MMVLSWDCLQRELGGCLIIQERVLLRVEVIVAHALRWTPLFGFMPS